MPEQATHQFDPNYSTSTVLVEVRTVLSRARTAIATCEAHPEFITKDGVWARPPGASRTEYIDGELIPHPDLDEMLAALRDTVAKLAKWEKRGTRRGA